MKSYEFETWDVFTDKRFAGNPLAVVFGARDLDTDQMQAITREFNLSETTFILPPENKGNTARVRIFTPAFEIPFAGHPTVGTAIAISRAGNLSGEVRLELNAGLFPVGVEVGAASAYARFVNPNLPAETGPAPSAELIEKALCLPHGAVSRDSRLPRRVGTGGVDYVNAHAELNAVRGARIDSANWENLDLDQAVGILLYADGGDHPGSDYHVRMFAPGAGVSEDPATGSAAAAFPGQIALSQNLEDGVHRWAIEQGIEMGRPSRIEIDFEVKHGNVCAVGIGGKAAPVASGRLRV